MNKEVDQLLRELRVQGWRVERTRGGHYKAFPPDPAATPVVIPGTPSDSRSLRNTIGLLRRGGFIWKGR